jgi:hypothetical protein
VSSKQSGSTPSGNPEPTGYPRRRPGVYVEHVGPGHALVDGATGDTHIVNDSALALWELCDGQTALAEMVDAVCELFSASREQVEADLQRTLAEFGRVGVLEWVAAPG